MLGPSLRMRKQLEYPPGVVASMQRVIKKSFFVTVRKSSTAYMKSSSDQMHGRIHRGTGGPDSPLKI